jgi:hypothetical protein
MSRSDILWVAKDVLFFRCVPAERIVQNRNDAYHKAFRWNARELWWHVATHKMLLRNISMPVYKTRRIIND